jgi:hypothetical protein
VSGLIQDIYSVEYLRTNHKIGDIIEATVAEKFDSLIPMDRPVI